MQRNTRAVAQRNKRPVFEAVGSFGLVVARRDVVDQIEEAERAIRSRRHPREGDVEEYQALVSRLQRGTEQMARAMAAGVLRDE